MSDTSEQTSEGICNKNGEKKMQTALSTVGVILGYMYASCFVWNIYAFGFLINDWI